MEKIYIDGKYKLCGILNINNNKSEMSIICHARTSSKDSRPTTLLSEELNRNGINNFRFDFVSCGESSGDWNDYTVSNMIDNLNDVLDYFKQKKGIKKFNLIGCSMGGRIISLVDCKKYNVNKLVLWYPALDYRKGIFNLPGKKEIQAKKDGYFKIEKGVKLSYEYFKDERKYCAYKNLYRNNIQKIFLHGDKDPFVNYKNTVKIVKKCKNSKLYIINGGDHGFHDDNCMKEALAITIAFIK